MTFSFVQFISLAAMVVFMEILPKSASAQVSFLQTPNYPLSGTTFAGDFAGNGKIGLINSNGSILLGNGNGTFTNGVPVPLPSGANVVAVADLDGDGKADLLLANGFNLSVLLGNGDATFQTPKSIYTAVNNYNVAVSDVNGDGKLDVLVNSGTLFVFLGNGDGTFTAGGQFPLGPSSPIVMGDFNGDGKIDVASFTTVSNGGEIVLAMGNGDGSFQAPKITSFSLFPGVIAAGDFNGDGKLDLVIITIAGGGISTYTISTLLGNGDGTFQAPSNPIVAIGNTFAIGDLLGNGKLDLVVTDSAAFAQVLLGNGNGSFTPGQAYYLGFESGSVVIADFNSDGKLDAAIGGAVLLGNGDGTCQGAPAVHLAMPVVGSSPLSSQAGIVTADFNGDGKPDLAAITDCCSAPSQLNILLGNGKGDFQLVNSYPVPGTAMLVGDVNGDGKQDLIFSQTIPLLSSWSLATMIGNGNGSFGSPNIASVGNSSDIPVLAVGDFNNDQKLDLAAILSTGNDQSVYIFLGNGDGTFANPVPYFAGTGTYGVVVGDFNGDGKLDLAVSGTAGLAILIGNGDGTFQPATFVSTSPQIVFAAADLRGIGRLDLLAGGTIFLGNGDGTFTAISQQLVGPGFVADFNGDGKLDIAVSNYTNFQSYIILGNGDGTFGAPIPIATSVKYGTEFSFQGSADFNLDGRPDLAAVVGALPGGDIAILLNTTSADFQLSAGAFSPANVQPGGSTNASLSVTVSGGFSGTISLTCSVTPIVTPAPICIVSPSSVQVPGSNASKTNVSFSTSASPATPPGTYLITVTANSGNLSHNAQPTVAVQATADFQASATAFAPGSIQPGGSASSTLSLTPVNGFSGMVNLACNVTPAVTPSPTCSVMPNSSQISGASASTMSVKFATTAPVAVASLKYVAIAPSALQTLGVVLVIGFGLWGLSQRRRVSDLARLAVVALASVSVGCGGGSSTSQITPGTPLGTYTVTLTATSGNLNHSVQVSIVVQ